MNKNEQPANLLAGLEGQALDRRQVMALIAGAASAAGLLGSGSAQSQETPRKGGVLNVATPINPSPASEPVRYVHSREPSATSNAWRTPPSSSEGSVSETSTAVCHEPLPTGAS